MSTTTSLKASLFKWPLFKTMTVQTDDGPVALDIRRPPRKLLAELMDKAKADGLAADDAGVTKNLEVLARITALCTFEPGGVAPFLSPEEALQMPALEEVGAACTAAIGSPEKAIEAAQGN